MEAQYVLSVDENLAFLLKWESLPRLISPGEDTAFSDAMVQLHTRGGAGPFGRSGQAPGSLKVAAKGQKNPFLGIDQQATIDAINADGGIAILSCTYWDGARGE